MSMWSIILGILTVCTQSVETVGICLAHYTDPAQLQATWNDYQRFREDISIYTHDRIQP